MRTLKYLLADVTKNKERFHQLYFIGAFLQAKVKNRFFSSCTLGIQNIFYNMHSTLEEPLRLLNSMYGMTNSGKLFDDELI